MEGDATAIIGAISALLLGVFGFVIKMWRDYSEITKQVITVVERNAVSNEKLTGTIATLKESVEKNTIVTADSVSTARQSRDAISQLLLEVVRQRPK